MVKKEIAVFLYAENRIKPGNRHTGKNRPRP
jgi:hypothetical protein